MTNKVLCAVGCLVLLGTGLSLIWAQSGPEPCDNKIYTVSCQHWMLGLSCRKETLPSGLEYCVGDCDGEQCSTGPALQWCCAAPEGSTNDVFKCTPMAKNCGVIQWGAGPCTPQMVNGQLNCVCTLINTPDPCTQDTYAWDTVCWSQPGGGGGGGGDIGCWDLAGQ